MKARRIISLVLLIVMIVAAVIALTLPSGHATKASAQSNLVYICQETPCTNSQEFEVFDAYGNPIFSVGEYGGDAVFGDNSSVFAPGNVFSPAVVTSYTTPAAYAAAHPGSPAGCTVPEMWIWPGGIDYCVNGGWVPFFTLPTMQRASATRRK
jgi:hypothetical protein